MSVGTTIREEAIQAHIRKCGGKLPALSIRICASAFVQRVNPNCAYPRQFLRVEDFETGAVSDWDFSQARLRCLGQQPDPEEAGEELGKTLGHVKTQVVDGASAEMTRAA